MGVSTTQLLAIILAFAVIVGGAIVYSGQTQQQSFDDTAETTADILLKVTACGDDNLGDANVCALDSLNNTRHCLAETARLYVKTDGEWTYTGASQVLTDSVNPTNFADLGCGLDYRLYFSSVDIASGQADSSGTGGFVGGYHDFTLGAEQQAVLYNSAKLHTLTFRLYDNENNDYVYSVDTVEDIEGNDNTTVWAQNTNDFVWNTTAATTLASAAVSTLGTDAEMDGKIYVKVHATNSTSSQYGIEEKLGNNYIAVDLQSQDDWDIDTVVIGNLPEVADVPTKINNLNYDIAFDANSVMPFKGSATSLDFYVKALSGVNPDDDVRVGFFFEGYFVSEGSFDMDLGVSEDDSSRTQVFTHTYFSILIS